MENVPTHPDGDGCWHASFFGRTIAWEMGGTGLEADATGVIGGCDGGWACGHDAAAQEFLLACLRVWNLGAHDVCGTVDRKTSIHKFVRSGCDVMVLCGSVARRRVYTNV